MTRDVIMNKAAVIERCIHRVQEVYDNDPANLSDVTKQDSMILNIQRACESAIDLAMHIVAEKQLGLPQTSRDAFDSLHNAGIINQMLTSQMKGMVGFRNIAIHDYQDIDHDILQHIITGHISEFNEFTRQVIHSMPND